MELAFAERDLRRLCESAATAQRRLGPEVAAALKARVADLWAADTVKDLPFAPRAEPDARPATMLFALVDGFHIRFRSNHHQHRTIDGAPDWSAVRRIQITAIERIA